MAKEMIVSVNGREKKIAILDNGRLTEFYIERGEENSGVVGNIYKGRVQRVLPGMQSAFVEIGLERDAFLYVSDFFDEEEEIERIVAEKSQKAPIEEASREATDRVQRQRLERERHMEDAQEIAEPLAESVEEQEAESAEPSQERNERGSRRRRGRRGGRNEERAPQAEMQPIENFVVEDDSSFERIVDDEDTGEMFKDAYRQEAIVDKVRAVEFEIEESAAFAEVGSILKSEEVASSGFERIADDDDAPAAKSNQRNDRSRRGGRKNKNEAPEKKAEAKKADAPKPEKKKKPVVDDKIVIGRKRPGIGFGAPEETAPAPEPVVEAVVEAPAETKAKPKKAAAKKPAKKAPAKRGSKAKTADAIPDGDVVVTETESVAEMTVRRGGRGRRRGQGRGMQVRSGKTEERFESNEMSEGAYEENEIQDAEFTPAPRNDRNNRRDRQQPTISDLLHEGQEILVQIAKEPIARKGARITSHIALPGRFLVYMPTIEHLGVSRKIDSQAERNRLRTLIQKIKQEAGLTVGGFIVRTAGIGVPDEELRQDARYLISTWQDIRKSSEKAKSPALVHQDLDIVQRLLRDQFSDDFTAIRVDSEEEYMRVVEFVNRIQPKMVSRVKLYTRDEPILEAYGVQEEIDKALKPRVWLKSGGYLVINQTEALVAIDVNTGKFVGKGNARLEDTITKTNMEAVEEISRQIRLRDLGGIIVLDLIDMEDRRNRQKVLQALQQHLSHDKSPTKVLSFNDFGLIIMTRKRVKQSLERTLCAPCENCQGSGWVKSPQTVCYEVLAEARRLSKINDDVRHTTLRLHPDVAKAMRSTERAVLDEIEAYLGNIDITADASVHCEQFDFAFI